MRTLLPAVLSLVLASGQASALNMVVDFPTLTWPPASPVMTPDLPTQGCVDTTTVASPLCPAPAR